MSMGMFVSVAVGGALGAVARYVAMSQIGRLLGTAFPYATLTVNVVGSAVLGALIVAFSKVWNPSPEIQAFIVVGVLGGFTTFSTFSLDVYYLLERGSYGAAGLYVFVSVAASVIGLVCGAIGLRSFLA